MIHLHHLTFKGVLLNLAIIFIVCSVISLPINLLRETYFSDKKTVVVTYQDKHTKKILVTKVEYDKWLLHHNGIKTVSGNVTPEKDIYCINLVYSIWTHDN